MYLHVCMYVMYVHVCHVSVYTVHVVHMYVLHTCAHDLNSKEPMNHGCGSRREGSRGAEWLHGHHRLCGDV